MARFGIADASTVSAGDQQADTKRARFTQLRANRDRDQRAFDSGPERTEYVRLLGELGYRAAKDTCCTCNNGYLCNPESPPPGCVKCKCEPCPSAAQYMAKCVTDGPLTPWVDNWTQAVQTGKIHELIHSGHAWDVATRVAPSPAAATTYVAFGRAAVAPVHTLADQQCKGNACDVVTYRYDGRNLFKNSSSNRKVAVDLHNWAAGETLHLGPGEEAASALQVFEVPYGANYE